MGYKTTGNIQGRMNTKLLTAATTITIEDSGTVFFLDAAGQAITLPAANTAKGVYYYFIVDTAVTPSSWVITSAGTNDIVAHGTTGADGAAALSSVEASVDLFTFVTGQANPADMAFIISNGTLWFCNVTSDVVAGATEG